MTESIGIVVTAVLTLAGLYFGNSLRLKTRTEVEASVAEKRFAAYAALWAQTKIASPMRLVPLTRVERSQLYDKLTDWYSDDGNGMLLTRATRNIYLKAKKNLTCPPEELVPESLVEQAAHDDGPPCEARRRSTSCRSFACPCVPTSGSTRNPTTRS
jgi:hypothetical protein